LQRRGPGWLQMRAIGPVQIEARAADPRGGPEWAVRVFHSRRLLEQAGRLRQAGRDEWCAQLGRVVGGRFGWVDAANRFRPTIGTDYRSNPYQCAPLRDDLGGIPRLVATNRITDPRDGELRPLQTAIWGFAGAAARELRLTVDGVADSIEATPHNVVLRLPPAGSRRVDGRLRASYLGSSTATADTSFRGRHELLGAGNPRALRIRRQRGWSSPRLPLAGAVPRLEYRVADPVRGIPLGVVAAPAEGGGWCVSDAHEIIGERVGQVDRKLGTFDDAPPSFNNGCRGVRDRGRALSLSFGFSMASAGKPAPGTARRRAWVERRTLRGTTSISGTARADVVSIRVVTPRDVRTIQPSPRAHAVVLLYDGGFPAGTIELTAKLEDGRTVSDSFGGMF
jgi:hypothetical protein